MQDVAGKQAQATGQALADAGKLMLDLQDIEDEATVKEADNYLLERLAKIDSDFGQQLGRNAVDSHEAHKKEVESAYKDVLAMTRNSRQENLLSQVASKRVLATQMSMDAHRFKQLGIWSEGADIARAQLNADSAVKQYITGDLTGYGVSMNTALESVDSRVARGTISPEEGVKEKLKTTSGVMSGVMDHMLANGQYETAKKFAKVNRDQFTADAYNNKISVVNNGLERQAGVSAADKFIKQANGDIYAALSLVQESDLSPTKKASASSQILQVAKAQDMVTLAQNKAYNDNRLNAWGVIANNPGDSLAVRKIPTPVTNNLNSNDITALMNGFNTYDDPTIIDLIQAHQNRGAEHWNKYVRSGELMNDAMRTKEDGTVQMMLTKESLFEYINMEGSNVGKVSFDSDVFNAGVRRNGLTDLLEPRANDKDKQKLYNLKVIYKAQLRDQYKGATPTLKQQQEVLDEILMDVKKKRRFGIPVSMEINHDAPWWDLANRLVIDRGYGSQNTEDIFKRDPIRYSSYITALRAAGLEPTAANIHEMHRKDTGK